MRQLRISAQITNRETKSFEKYLTEVSQVGDIINVAGEVELATIIQNSKDPIAVEKAVKDLCKANLRFVISVAKQYQGQGMPLGEIINEGNLGMLKAAYKFDHSRGFKFISYAVWWIRQSILKAIAETGRPIRLPLNKITELNKVKKALNSIEQNLGRPATISETIRAYAKAELINNFEKQGVLFSPTEEEISIEVDSRNWKPLITLIESQSKRVSSLDDFASNDDQSATIGDLMESGGFDDLKSELNQADLRVVLEEVMGKLPEKERYVLTNCFGIGGTEQKSLEEIGFKLELTKERVRQVRAKGLKRMKQLDKTGQLTQFMD
jgi:RNA polymerase primary sigma factor|tara:strand:- start:19676 stop:20647 length:972 start_codon:yes stop_codon:yes gene_type:complete